MELVKEAVSRSEESERAVFTIPAAARILEISPNSAYKAAERGEIPTIRIGRRLLVPRRALERLLEGER